MKLATKSRYAVMAILDLASHSHEKPVSLYKISERQDLSLDYLEQIFIKLKKNDIVRSIKGPGGGYLLTRNLNATTIADVITAISGEVKTVRCSDSYGCARQGKRCLAHNVWKSLDFTILNHLKSLSLAKLLKEGNKDSEKIIYMDYQSTTPTDERVLTTMMPYFTKKFGNPHSNHSFGWEANDAIDIARKQIASVIKANPKEIIFTSGATESNNLTLKGVSRFYKDKRNHIITVKTEHKCILDTCMHLEQEGFEITYLPVDHNGLISLSDLKNAIRSNTLLVSVMAVNNEIGVIQPLKEIGKICKERNVFFHTDAAAGFGKIPLDVKKMNINLMSISSHKIYGPKGVGALFVQSNPKVKLQPIINGGRQEKGIRSGTLPTPLIVGFGKAAELSEQEMETERTRLLSLNKKFLKGISDIPEVFLNGHKTLRWPGNINLSFGHIEGESMMLAMKDLIVSSGSACTSESLEPSYVLKAIGIDRDLSHTSIRFGLGRYTTENEVARAVSSIKQAVKKLRAMSPTWKEKITKDINTNKTN